MKGRAHAMLDQIVTLSLALLLAIFLGWVVLIQSGVTVNQMF